MLEILQKEFQIMEFYYDPYTHDTNQYNELRNTSFDVLLCWQILPPRHVLSENISFKAGVFFPMFDGAPDRSLPIWKDYQDFLIINFSKKLHNELVQMGHNSRYIQYWPKPKEIKNWGHENSIFFWNRREEITLDTMASVLNGNAIRHVHLHRALDPEQKFHPLTEEWDVDLTQTTWFDNKEELDNCIQNSALYMAPRAYEGIGMSFLEAMAQGRCVISPNNPTMNEYIRDGETGFLYELSDRWPISLKNIRDVQKKTYEAVCSGWKEWEKNKNNIISWIYKIIKINEDTSWPTVTIATCTWNLIKNGRKNHFYKTVSSILNQNYPGIIEYIIIDGGSTDGTIDLIADIKKQISCHNDVCDTPKINIKWISEQDNGIYYAMNKALNMAGGEYIAFLNSDDFYCSVTAVKDSIARILFEDADGSYANARIVDYHSEDILGEWEGSIRLVPFGQYPNHQTVFVSTKALKEVGGFDTSLICIADNNSFCKLLGEGKKLVRLNKTIVHFRDGGFSNSGNASKISLEKSKRGNELFNFYFCKNLSHHEAMLFYDFAFLRKHGSFYLGNFLPDNIWKEEFYNALFTNNIRGLVSFYETRIPSECVDLYNVGEFKFYYCTIIDFIRQLINSKEKNKYIKRSAYLVKNYIIFLRYRFLYHIFIGNRKAHYKRKYFNIKKRLVRISDPAKG